MNGIYVACALLLILSSDHDPAIHKAQDAVDDGAAYVKPLSYKNCGEIDSMPAVGDPMTYDELREEAIYNCKNARHYNVDTKIVDKLIEIEKQYNVPPRLRGMLLAAACNESGFDPNARGDWRTIRRRGKDRRVAKAVGLFQMWPWWENKKRGYGIDRRDVDQTAHAFIRHVKKQLGKIKCKRFSEYRRWVAAWVTAIRSPKVGGRCAEKPKHLKVLRRWHRNIKKERAAVVIGC